MSYTPQPDQDTFRETPEGGDERSELASELRQLGQQLEATFRAFVAGPGQTIRREVGEAFHELGTQVQRAAGAIQQRPEKTEIEQRARRAAQQLQEKPIVREMEETLVGGLHQINAQLRRLTERLERQVETGQPAQSNATQRLVIEEEPSDDGGTPPAA